EQRLNARHRLRFDGSYTFQDVSNRTNPEADTYGLQIAYTPKHTGSASLSWESPWMNLTFHGTGTSRRWATNQHYEDTDVAGFVDCGLTVCRTFLLRHNKLEIRGDIKNLFNKQYEIVGHYPMPGRSWQVSVMWIM
ncbi:MAG: TonB-dependent receptor, partial [Bacteroidaceae bacterium]|nr:TonB-dependent receptor [Bacteroidaceae bacterium]